MDEERIQLTLEESGERIDALLARTFPALSRSLIQKCIEAGGVTLDGKTVKKNAKTVAGATVEFCFPETEELELLPPTGDSIPAPFIGAESAAIHSIRDPRVEIEETALKREEK